MAYGKRPANLVAPFANTEANLKRHCPSHLNNNAHSSGSGYNRSGSCSFSANGLAMHKDQVGSAAENSMNDAATSLQLKPRVEVEKISEGDNVAATSMPVTTDLMFRSRSPSQMAMALTRQLKEEVPDSPISATVPTTVDIIGKFMSMVERLFSKPGPFTINCVEPAFATIQKLYKSLYYCGVQKQIDVLDPIQTCSFEALKAVNQGLAHWKPTPIIGLKGQTGVGKSTLLNALVDCEDIAPSSGMGIACTIMPVEYAYLEPDPKTPELQFKANICYLSEDEFLSEATNHVHFILDHHHEHCEDNDEEYKKAWTWLLSIFPTLTGYELWNGLPPSLDVALKTLKSRATRQYKHIGASKTITAPTREEFIEKLTDYISTVHDPGDESEVFPRETNEDDESGSELSECEPEEDFFGPPRGIPKPKCPLLEALVKKVQVYLTASILQTGLVIVDLPGGGDISAARTKMTEEYTAKCDAIILALNSSRALVSSNTSKLLESPVYMELKKRGFKDILTIVCTRTDEAFKVRDARKNKSDHKLMQLVKEGDEDIKDLRSSGQVLDDSERENKVKERERRLLLDIIRRMSTKISTKIKSQFQGAKKKEDIIPEVFCVSAKQFLEAQENKDNRMYEDEVEASEIPQLCSHLLALVKARQERMAEEFLCYNALPLLRTLYRVYKADPATVPGSTLRESIKDIVKTHLRALKGDLSSGVEGMTGSLRSTMKKLKIAAEAAAATALSEVPKSLAKWQRTGFGGKPLNDSVHVMTFRALMRNDGEFGDRNINKSFMEPILQAIGLSLSAVSVKSELWEREVKAGVCSKVRSWASKECEQIKRCHKSIRDGLNATDLKLNTSTASLHILDQLPDLDTAIFNRANEISYLADSDICKEHRVRADKLTFSIPLYPKEYLEKAYSLASQERGAGCYARMVQIILDVFKNRPDFFQHCIEDLEASLETLVQSIETTARQHNETLLTGLKHKYNGILGVIGNGAEEEVARAKIELEKLLLVAMDGLSGVFAQEQEVAQEIGDN